MFTWEGLDNAAGAYAKLVAKVAALKDEGDIDEAVFREYRDRFKEALASDLNTSNGITELYNVFKAKTTDATKLALIRDYDRVLSLDLEKAAARLKEKEAASETDGDEEKDEFTLKIEEMIERRMEAKRARDFATADAIRAELASMGVEITDTPQGTKYTIKQ